MSVLALSYLADPNGTFVARGDSGPSLQPLIAVVAAVLVLVLLFGGLRSNVVVVEQRGGSFGGFLGVISIVIAVGIIWLTVIAPGRGSA